MLTGTLDTGAQAAPAKGAKAPAKAPAAE